jgi:hypothetical protein
VPRGLSEEEKRFRDAEGEPDRGDPAARHFAVLGHRHKNPHEGERRHNDREPTRDAVDVYEQTEYPEGKSGQRP